MVLGLFIICLSLFLEPFLQNISFFCACGILFFYCLEKKQIKRVHFKQISTTFLLLFCDADEIKNA